MGDGGTKSGGELVGRTVSFLSKRDGIDKLLKLAKYLSSLGIEVEAGGKGANQSGLRDLDKAFSLSRSSPSSPRDRMVWVHKSLNYI